MRISTLTNDPSFTEAAYDAEVLIDGVKSHNCVIADDDKNYAIIHVKDENGELQVDPFGNIRTEKVDGNIEIKLPNGITEENIEYGPFKP